ncbi:hypothetical protein CEXT_47261 [Caerostris extrusa]|uniref:Uncharacterized protein n=1 Tax=Caerostris extrusa TaxID=172846 RepID=A0AAV4VVE0_CAEEX|nr:hypothetical protein CEXT_47261 [Caerostris extrusa]
MSLLTYNLKTIIRMSLSSSECQHLPNVSEEHCIFGYILIHLDHQYCILTIADKIWWGVKSRSRGDRQRGDFFCLAAIVDSICETLQQFAIYHSYERFAGACNVGLTFIFVSCTLIYNE